MEFYFKDTNQISEMVEYKPHVYPIYNKSTTDPTYYEPQASRIANMKKASGVQLEGIYDFYEKSDVDKFNATNFEKYISTAQIDPRFNNHMLKEEISQVTTDLGYQAQNIVEDIKKSNKEKLDRIDEAVKTSKVISDSQTSEE